MRLTAEHLAFLLVLQKQVKKEEKDAHEANERTTRSSRGVPKANNLKRAFRKLETAYEKTLKFYVKAKKEAENVMNCTP